MPAIEVGRICVKTAGREAGRKCVVVDLLDKNFAVVTGPREFTGVKRRRANLDHLKPTDERIEIKKGASDEEIGKMVEKMGWQRILKERAVKEVPERLVAEEKPEEEAEGPKGRARKRARPKVAKPKEAAEKPKARAKRKKKAD